MLSDDEIIKIKDLCKETRINVIKMVYNAQSGHIGGALSSAELMTVLYHKCMNVFPKWSDDKNFEKRR